MASESSTSPKAAYSQVTNEAADAQLAVLEKTESFEVAEVQEKCPAFVGLTALACSAALAAELFENGRGVDTEAPPTEACGALRFSVAGRLACCASPAANWLLGPTSDVLLGMGARQGRGIVHGGEWWRLLAPMYLHGGLVHFAMNMASLHACGARLERAHGCFGVGAIYLLSGLFGNVMGAALAPNTVSVGASGAVFGLVGACVGEVVQNWGVYVQPCRALLHLLTVAGFQLALGTMPMIDNFAHFFGFLMGFVSSLGLLVLPRRTSSGRRLGVRPSTLCLQALATAAVPLAFAFALWALYRHRNARHLCPWCSALSCLPFPWGCDASERGSCWAWDCSACGAGAALTAQSSWVGSQQNGTVVISCPDAPSVSPRSTTNEVAVWPVDVSGFGSGDLLELCKDHCPDAYL